MQFRYVREALLLARRDRRIDEPAILVDDRVARVLPTLVADAVGRPRLVFVQAVAVEIGRTVEPTQRLDRRLDERRDESLVAGPVPELRNDEWIKGGRRRRAVTSRPGIEIESRERAGVHLVDHPAGF